MTMHDMMLQSVDPKRHLPYVLGVCTCIVGACGSVSVYLHHCVQELKKKDKKVFTMWDEHDKNV